MVTTRDNDSKMLDDVIKEQGLDNAEAAREAKKYALKLIQDAEGLKPYEIHLAMRSFYDGYRMTHERK